MRKCFLLKLNLRILAQLKVLIFVFPYNENIADFRMKVSASWFVRQRKPVRKCTS